MAGPLAGYGAIRSAVQDRRLPGDVERWALEVRRLTNEAGALTERAAQLVSAMEGVLKDRPIREQERLTGIWLEAMTREDW